MELKPIIDFLSELNSNNSVQWMSENKSKFIQAKDVFEHLVEKLIDGISMFDNSIINLTAKDCIFRLNRDIRFTKDKSPYKNYFSAHIIAGGRKSLLGGYYIQIHHQDQTLIGGGIHTPTKEMLQHIRKEISLNGDELSKLMEEKEFKSIFSSFFGDKLKKSPLGFSPEHPHIELLKMKNFDLVYNYDNKDFLKPDILKDIIYKFQIMKPVNDFLNNAVRYSSES